MRLPFVPPKPKEFDNATRTGARRALPNRAIIVHPGRVRVEILEPRPVPDSARAADELRRAARRQILARLDEPDLAPQQTRGR